jgi:hypothetical protein
MLRHLRHRDAMRALLATVGLLASAACGEAPPVRLTPAPQPVDSSLGVDLSDDLQEMVLRRLRPLLPALVERHWGVPPRSASWRLRVDVEHHIPEAPPSCPDTLVVPTPRERALAAFCRDVTAALAPTDTSRPRGEGTERWLRVVHLATRHDTIWANVDVSATQRCPGDGWAHASLSFQYHFVRRRGRWRLVSETPELSGHSVGISDSTCVPRPMHLWESPPPGPPPGSRPPRRRAAR